MEVTNTMDALTWLRKHLEDADPDLLRSMVKAFADLADVGRSQCAVQRRLWRGHLRAGELVLCNGYRSRGFDTRAGTIELAIPKLRTFERELLPRLAHRTPVGGGPNGPSSRSWPSATSRGSRPAGSTTWSSPWESMGSRSPRSPSWPSRSTRSCPPFRSRPLDAGSYSYVWLDALTQKVKSREGASSTWPVVVATGVNADGHREILGLDLVTTEDGAGWTAFLRGLVARGLSAEWPW